MLLKKSRLQKVRIENICIIPVGIKGKLRASAKDPVKQDSSVEPMCLHRYRQGEVRLKPTIEMIEQSPPSMSIEYQVEN